MTRDEKTYSSLRTARKVLIVIFACILIAFFGIQEILNILIENFPVEIIIESCAILIAVFGLIICILTIVIEKVKPIEKVDVIKNVEEDPFAKFDENVFNDQ